jgi:hypothetical protein
MTSPCRRKHRARSGIIDPMGWVRRGQAPNRPCLCTQPATVAVILAQHDKKVVRSVQWINRPAITDLRDLGFVDKLSLHHGGLGEME